MMIPETTPWLAEAAALDRGGLRAEIGASRAVLLCTPECAGALPGSFKNLLDWTVGGAEMYGKPVAWANVSLSPTGAGDAHASLARILGYFRADIVAAACVRIPAARGDVGDDRMIAGAGVRERIVGVLTCSHGTSVCARRTGRHFGVCRD